MTSLVVHFCSAPLVCFVDALDKLNGEIPRELGNLVNLQVMSLSGNQLSGEIPPELGNLVNSTRLFLGGNRLSGCVPASLQGKAVSDLPHC